MTSLDVCALLTAHLGSCLLFPERSGGICFWCPALARRACVRHACPACAATHWAAQGREAREPNAGTCMVISGVHACHASTHWHGYMRYMRASRQLHMYCILARYSVYHPPPGLVAAIWLGDDVLFARYPRLQPTAGHIPVFLPRAGAHTAPAPPAHLLRYISVYLYVQLAASPWHWIEPDHCSAPPARAPPPPPPRQAQ